MIPHRIRGAIALAAVGLCSGALAQQGHGYDSGRYYDNRQVTLVRCESHDERTRYCTGDIRGDVRLVNQLSRSRCIEGRSWGWDRRGIWVTDGCRAEFEVDQGSGHAYDDDRSRRDYGRNRVIRCESTNSRTVYCNADTRYGVRLLTQHSRAACIEGRTWGFNYRGVWVANGCRAQFQIGGRGYEDNRYGDDRYGYGDDRYGYGDDRYGYTQGRRLTCESNNERYNFCRVSGHIRQAQIRDQKSRDACQYNYSWGYRADGIWVDHGCRAEFVIY
jgi:hypothetical protein